MLRGEQRVRPALVAAKPLIAQQKPQLTAAKATAGSGRSPSFWWALLANWLYFMSLGLSIPNLPYVVGGLVNPLKDGAVNTDPTTPAAIRVSGDIEALDQALELDPAHAPSTRPAASPFASPSASKLINQQRYACAGTRSPRTRY